MEGVSAEEEVTERDAAAGARSVWRSSSRRADALLSSANARSTGAEKLRGSTPGQTSVR